MASSESRTPPKVESGVFYVTATTLIDAPIETAWGLLSDFQSYHDWNSFVRQQYIVDSHSTLKRSEDQTPAAGKLLYMAQVHLPPTMGKATKLFQLQRSKEVILVADGAPNYRLAWHFTGVPKSLLYAERWQTLSTMEVDGKTYTKYESIEVFSGILAYIIKVFLKGRLGDAFRIQGEVLKEKAESLNR